MAAAVDNDNAQGAQSSTAQELRHPDPIKTEDSQEPSPGGLPTSASKSMDNDTPGGASALHFVDLDASQRTFQEEAQDSFNPDCPLPSSGLKSPHTPPKPHPLPRNRSSFFFQSIRLARWSSVTSLGQGASGSIFTAKYNGRPVVAKVMPLLSRKYSHLCVSEQDYGNSIFSFV